MYRKGTNFRGVKNFAVFADRTLSTKFNPQLHCAHGLKIRVCALVRLFTCMSSVDDDDLDRILRGLVFDELVAMTEPPQQPGCSQNLLGVVLAPTAKLQPVKAGQGNCRKKALARGIVYLLY